MSAVVSAERTATPHTAVLISSYREVTALRSGLIEPKGALRRAGFDGLVMSGMTCRGTMRLGNQRPFYEVAFRGKVYRILSRPVPGQRPDIHYLDIQYELIRTWAPGLICDGWLMQAPTAVPNTPRALVEELRAQLNVSVEDIISDAHSIYHFRLKHSAQYPNTMEPPGYTFRELFLMSVDAAGNLCTLYETPKGSNVELWTMFLRELDGKNPARLADYVNSSMALKEFGEDGVAAMHQALRLRLGNSRSAIPMVFKRFVDAFANSQHAKTREVIFDTRFL